MTDTVGPMRPYVAPRPNRPDECELARRACRRQALTQPDPHADLALLLDALGLREEL